jgi:hypothetical protein
MLKFDSLELTSEIFAVYFFFINPSLGSPPNLPLDPPKASPRFFGITRKN